MQTISKKGFTLVELLIVIGILAVLATTAVVILNPAQLLAQARDSQRLSDLASINSAISLYQTDADSVDLGACVDGAGVLGRSNIAITAGSFASAGANVVGTRVVGTAGWVDARIDLISGGSPLPVLPVDPINLAANDFIYRYACEEVVPATYELNACLESLKYQPYMFDDGGDKNAGVQGTQQACTTTSYYEIGTGLTQ